MRDIWFFGSCKSRAVVLIAAMSMMTSMPALAAGAPVAGSVADMEPLLRSAVQVNGEKGLTEALELLLASRPALLTDAETAADVMTMAGNILLEETQGARPDFGAVSSVIVRSAPASLRADISYGVTNAVVSLLNPLPAVTAEVLEDEVEVEGTSAPEQRSESVQSPAPKPLRAGGFLLYPDVTASAVYDSNIFATRNARVDDVIAVISPYIEAESAWSRHYLNLKANAEIGFYDQRTTEDYEDYSASMDGRFDLADKTNVFGGGSYDRLHESRESADDINGIEPTTYDIWGAYGGITQGMGRLRLRLGGTFQKIDYNPVATSGGVVTNIDRDRKLYTGGLRGDFDVTSRFGIFAQAAADIRRYEVAPPDALYDRDSDGERYLGGIRFNVSKQINGEVFAGYLKQDYDDPLLEDVDDLAFGGSLNYAPNARSTVTLYADRSVSETTLTGSSALLSTVFSANVEHVVAPQTWYRADVAYSHGQYQGIDRIDNVINAETSIQYYFNPFIYLETAYRFRHLHSTSEIEDYDRHQIIVRLGSQLYAADIDTPRLTRSVSGPDIFAGGYAGLMVGYGGLDSKVAGPRGPDSTITNSDFGGHGGTWGLYAGYGVVLNPIYLGMELEGEASNNEWSFDRGEEIREFSVRKRLAYGIGGRIGYALNDNALFYGRFGVVQAEFISRYALGTTLIDTDYTKTGLRFGGGAEVPLTPRLWLRLDYVFTDYGSYEVDYDSGQDAFNNSENLFRIGATYRL